MHNVINCCYRENSMYNLHDELIIIVFNVLLFPCA